ncbi:MAG: hypothetical protein QS748_08225 [Candidatus Endonucleobacter bathymodioli]|uniref:Uncharacterized protein n=1 Tax=Candidatus Endonucleibacter bathymodioli TaxID=539814 RepID=A0AA90SY16_9GAMM|nr:hypothetical protein [Candidatus Endonucleobacter bathymodioli]
MYVNKKVQAHGVNSVTQLDTEPSTSGEAYGKRATSVPVTRASASSAEFSCTQSERRKKESTSGEAYDPNVTYLPNDDGQAANLISIHRQCTLKSQNEKEFSLLFNKELSNLFDNNGLTTSGMMQSTGCIGALQFSRVMFFLCNSSISNDFPKNIIGIGSGNACIEKAFSYMLKANVKCYDNVVDHSNNFMFVEQAEFPKDIGKCLPYDCSKHILFSGYPQGYLGPILSEYIKRGGEMLCTTVENRLFDDMHSGYEDDENVLEQGIVDLIEKKSGESFQFDVSLKSSRRSMSTTYMQFYNWPSVVKQKILLFPSLNTMCSDIELEYFRMKWKKPDRGYAGSIL